MLSKIASSTIFWVFGMTRPEIEHKSPGSLANTLTIMPMSGIIILIVNKKQRTCRFFFFYSAVPTDHRVKLEVTVILIVICALSIVTKGMIKELGELEIITRVETIQTTLLRLKRILRKVLETWGNMLPFRLQWRTIN